MDDWQRLTRRVNLHIGHISSVGHMLPPARVSTTRPELLIWTGPHHYGVSPLADYVEYRVERAEWEADADGS